MSRKEVETFAEQWIYKKLTPSSQHKIGYFEFLPTKQEYELVKDDCADEISQRFFSNDQTDEDYEIFEDESIGYD